jgi:hypothetical protein
MGKGTDGYGVSALFNAYRQFLTDEGRTASLNNVTYFLKSSSDRHGNMPVADLRGHHVRDWLNAGATWGNSSKRLAVGRVEEAAVVE